MVEKTIILLVLYLLQFYIKSLWGKKYFANSRQEPEPHVFGPIGAGAA